MKKPAKPKKPDAAGEKAELRRRAENQLRDRRPRRPKGASAERLLHELEVHQIELEMQNAELQKSRDDLEGALEKYTELYDFAPVGYLSLDASSVILEANLTGAALLGIERSRLIKRRLSHSIPPSSRPDFLRFLQKVFSGPKIQVCEVPVQKEGGGTFWAGLRAASSDSPTGAGILCRLAFADVTVRRQSEEAQRRVEALAATNLVLNAEIARRREVEKALQASERHQTQLLKQAHHLQGQLRFLSHRILNLQEEERKRISRELHDEIAQTLVGINVQLAALTREAMGDPKDLAKKIARTQQLVETSVDVVHRFARDLRPTMLDDLGLIPALHSFMKGFTQRTGIRVRFKTFAASRVEQFNNATRTVLYRVAQEALTNVARHAEASVVDVSLERLPGAIRLKVVDDGKSFQADRVLGAKRHTRLGLIGMRERLEMVGGRFEIESSPGRGTTVRAEIPIGTEWGGNPGDGTG